MLTARYQLAFSRACCGVTFCHVTTGLICGALHMPRYGVCHNDRCGLHFWQSGVTQLERGYCKLWRLPVALWTLSHFWSVISPVFMVVVALTTLTTHIVCDATVNVRCHV